MHRNNNQNNQNNRNNRRTNRNGRNRNHGQRNPRAENKEQKDKKVPMRYQPRSSKETSSVEFKHEIDGNTEKTKLNIYEDGYDEDFLKLIKEFQNYIETYGIWNQENANAANTVYRNFRRCLAGATRDLWDQINVVEEEDGTRDEMTFWDHLRELTSAVLGEDALRNQKEYLKNTPKPENMSVKQWVNRIKNINSYLPLMQEDGRAFSEEDLIAEVITKNIPSAWNVQFRLAKLHLKTRIKDIISDLTVIEENIKTHHKNDHDKSNRKQLKNPCRLHNGGHEWEDCRQNPKNQKNEDKNRNNENNRSRNGNNNNNRGREEQRRTESDRRTTREREQEPQ